jgi:hypothetical protein
MMISNVDGLGYDLKTKSVSSLEGTPFTVKSINKKGGELNQGSSPMLFVLDKKGTNRNHTLDGWDIKKGATPRLNKTSSTPGYLKAINKEETKSLKQVGENLYIKPQYKKGGLFPRDKEMVDGVKTLLRKVKDKENRKEMLNYILTDFKKENVKVNESEFTRQVMLKKGRGLPPKYPGSGTKDDCYYKAVEKYGKNTSAYRSGYMSACRKKKLEKGGTFDKERKEGLRGWFGRPGGSWKDCISKGPCGGKKAGTKRLCRPTLKDCPGKEKLEKLKRKKTMGESVKWDN